MNDHKRHPDSTNVMDHAYLSQADRYNKLLMVLTDPDLDLSPSQTNFVLTAAEAIEQEWLVPPSDIDPDHYE